MKRRITLLLMALMVVSTALPQTTRSKGESKFPGSTSRRGANWEKFTISGKSYEYFKGSKEVDEQTTEKLLGFHWKGSKYTDVIGEELYLCNMETGEYLQIGDLWGENGMTSHVGIPYKLIVGTSTRHWNGTLSDMGSDTYWLQPLNVRENRVVGRAAVAGSGAQAGHYEYNKHLYLRTQREYSGDSKGNGTHVGGFLFKFKEYEIDNQICYIIYTHRKTDNEKGQYAEFQNRDSYLLLRSVGSTATADFNNVHFKKFAGQMGQKLPGIKMTFQRTSTTAATVNLTDMQGNNISGASAQLVGLEFSGESTPQMKTGNASALIDGTVLAPDHYANNANAEISFIFRIQGVPSTYSFNAANLDVYNMNGGGTAQQTSTDEGKARNFQFFVKMGSSVDDLSDFASKTTNSNIVSPDVVPNSYGGLDYGPQILTAGGSQTATSDFYIKVTLKNITGSCYAGIGSVSLYDNSNLTGEYYGDFRDNPVGDEVDYYNQNKINVSLDDGLAAEKLDKKNLWKLVRKKERDRYRIVASDAKPVDVSSRIFNPKFNTSYVYNLLMNECEVDGSHYVPKNWEDHPDYGWTWYNEDRPDHHPETHKPHVHPWPDNSNEATLGYSKEKEFHKVGTGRFWRFSERNAENNGYIGGHDNNMQEMHITYGVDANYCGSIFKGTANVQQTISGLRAGNYIVYVRGFFAPHDMEKYEKQADGSYFFNDNLIAANGSASYTAGDAVETWYNEAISRIDEDGTPVWRRSHDSYLFAWTKPDYKSEDDPGEKVEVRRMLPSIYEGATPVANLTTMSKESMFSSDKLRYTDRKSVV